MALKASFTFHSFSSVHPAPPEQDTNHVAIDKSRAMKVGINRESSYTITSAKNLLSRTYSDIGRSVNSAIQPFISVKNHSKNMEISGRANSHSHQELSKSIGNKSDTVFSDCAATQMSMLMANTAHDLKTVSTFNLISWYIFSPCDSNRLMFNLIAISRYHKFYGCISGFDSQSIDNVRS